MSSSLVVSSLHEVELNAAEQVDSVAFAHSLASAITLFRKHFPAATPNLRPWSDDPETRQCCESATLDLAFHFPGWSPRLQCRSLLLQLMMSSCEKGDSPYLLGVVMRGMTFDGERWRLVTMGDWQPAGSYLPAAAESAELQTICRDLFALFPQCSA